MNRVQRLLHRRAQIEAKAAKQSTPLSVEAVEEAEAASGDAARPAAISVAEILRQKKKKE